MISRRVSELVPDMVIMEEDSYGNNVYVVKSKPYKYQRMLVVDCEDVLTKEIMQIGGIEGHEPTLYQILPSRG